MPSPREVSVCRRCGPGMVSWMGIFRDDIQLWHGKDPPMRRLTAAARHLSGRSRLSISSSLLALLLGLLIAGSPVPTGAAGGGAMSGMGPATSAATFVPAYRTQVEQVDLDRVGIRFVEETAARVREGRLVSLTADPAAAEKLASVEAIVAAIPGARMERRFPASESDLDQMRSRAIERTRRDVPNLNLFALVRLPAMADEAAAKERLRGVLSALNGAEGVAEAWALPIGVPASRLDTPVDSRAYLPVVEPVRAATGDAARLSRTTPDFSPMQGYLYNPPSGIWADSAWSFAGGLGQGVKIIDMEWGWLWTHEDLKAPFYVGNEQGPSDHGTAVLGEYAGQHNGYGVNGIAPEVQIGGIHLDDIAADVLEAISVLSPGDIYVMEVQVGGPENWMPVEWWPDVYAAISTGSALGVICCEAAGNGSVHLDDPLYGDYFDRRVRDSGAIMVGAGTPNGLDAESFSNHGSRLSLQGWGSSVTTTGYGNLQGGDPEVWYTNSFNGTSSATPIVTGAVASLQGQALALFGEPLTPGLAEEILRATGTPQAGTRTIGPRPNLVAARERLLLGFGEVAVTVRDGSTHQPLPGVVIEIAETGRIDVTGSNGDVVMQLTAGPLVFHIPETFYYPALDYPCNVIAGEFQEVTIDLLPSPFGSIAGQVRAIDGSGIPGARIVLPGTPIDAVWTDAAGAFTIPGVPERTGYDVLASQVPGFGAVHAEVAVTGGQATDLSPVLPDAETFESGQAGFTATNEWEWGTPTFPYADPVPTFSGTKVWGTKLAGAYGDLKTSVLTSPVYDLSGYSSLTLSFHHYYWIDPDDGGQLQVWDPDQGLWVVVEPVGGYPDDNIIILLYTGGYNGQLEGYEPAIFHLDAYAGRDFKFRFYFRSNISGHKLGWYIDDVALDLGDGQTLSIDPSEFTASSEGVRLIGGGPNPTSTDTRLFFEIPAESVARLEVFSPNGARVRLQELGRLRPGRHEAAWDGRDDAGRMLGSGLYLYRLSVGIEAITGRIVRVK